MNALKIVTGLLAVCITLPINIYLQYHILAMIHATDVMWLLFFVNLPLAILMVVVGKIIESVK